MPAACTASPRRAQAPRRAPGLAARWASYETDYWATCYKEATAWAVQHAAAEDRANQPEAARARTLLVAGNDFSASSRLCFPPAISAVAVPDPVTFAKSFCRTRHDELNATILLK